jgi:2-dehydro-3-deoxygluconokinase
VTEDPLVGLLETAQGKSFLWDLAALGEVMLRLDPGAGRIATTRAFSVWEGGAEYNVARGLKRCFGMSTAIVTALADNPVGRLIEDLMYQGGVDQRYVSWVPYDGIGRTVRNGLNFTERGFGVRAALGCSDRGHSAASQMKPGDVEWEQLFALEGVRWFHCGGIYCALSEPAAELAREGMEVARRHRAVVSYDLNYRSSLWNASGGPERAVAVNRELVQHVDVLLGNEEDFTLALGHKRTGIDESLLDLDIEAYAELLEDVMTENPQLSLVASTLRQARTATINDWTAVCRTRRQFYVGPSMTGLEILDRVGGGDGFASGFFYGLLTGKNVDQALAYGVAHGAVAMTTPGDNSMTTLVEVERLLGGGAVRVTR